MWKLRCDFKMDKMRENGLTWFGHIMKRKESQAVRIVMKINVRVEKNTEKERIGFDWKWYKDGWCMWGWCGSLIRGCPNPNS